MSNLTSMAQKLRPIIEKAVSFLDDSDALEAKILFPHWTLGVSYQKNYRVLYNNILYKCLQEHTSQIGTEPNFAPELWTQVS